MIGEIIMRGKDIMEQKPKERPILFTGEMVRAILDGRKTVTRRVMKPQPNDKYMFYDMQEDGNALFVNEDAIAWGNVHGFSIRNPYGRPGDLLYVRETWQAINHDGQYWNEVKKEDRPLHNWSIIYRESHNGKEPPKWIPSIFMPKLFSRIWLRVKDNRPERVQEIDNHWSWAEGIPEYSLSNHLWTSSTPRNPERFYDGIYRPEARDVFAELWDKINAKRGYSWDSNPWVFAVEFEKVER